MSRSQQDGERELRREIFESYRELFASAPIRLMSRAVSAMRARGYPDLASAIGDMDWRTVPADDPEDPALRSDWGDMVTAAVEHIGGWMGQLGAHSMGYNLDSVGSEAVTAAWSGLWRRQLGIELVNERRKLPQVSVFHGGNQALQAAFLGVSEAHRDRVGTATPPTLLVPIPTFSCPTDQMALQGMRVYFAPPGDPGMDPSPEDVRGIPEGVDVDAAYLMPINNPTGRTLPPERLKAVVDAVLARWPHAGVILDSVYVRLHPDHRRLLAWYDDSPLYRDAILFVDSLSKSHGVTGLRAGALLTAATRFARGALRYSQNVVAGPSNVMQAAMLSLLAPFVTGDDELMESRIRLSLRIGRHLQRRRRLFLERAFADHRDLLDPEQPLLPDSVGFDWPGSMYADLRLSDRCLEIARANQVSATVAFYFETGIGGVPLEGFCSNVNLVRHGLVVNADDPALQDFQREASRYVRLSFGMTPPPRGM